MSVRITNELNNFESQAIIKVCGIGGGGGNAVGRMIEAGMQDVDFITINTDAQALKNSPAGTRLQIGEAGLGAGAKPAMGEQAAVEHKDRIGEVLTGADMIFLTAGLGGGTGTGAIPVVAQLAKDTGALTVAIVTLPFQFEGGERMLNAQHGLEALQKHVDATIVVPNDRLSILCQTNITFLNAFRLADEVLHNGVRAISELITKPGLINLDFADVRTIMQNSGRALMGIGTADGENRATRAAEEAIVCPLLENSTIDGSLGVIVNVQGGSDIAMREVHDAVTTVQKSAHPKANIIFGAVIEDNEQEEVTVTVIAAGFSAERSSQVTVPAFGTEEAEEREVAQVDKLGTLAAAIGESLGTPEPSDTYASTMESIDEESESEPSDAPQEPWNTTPVQIMFPDDDDTEDEPADVEDGSSADYDGGDFDIPTFKRNLPSFMQRRKK